VKSYAHNASMTSAVTTEKKTAALAMGETLFPAVGGPGDPVIG
jgi:hypothetical protein